MVTGWIKFDAVWINDVVKSALAERIGGATIKQLKVVGQTLEDRTVRLIVSSKVVTAQGDEMHVNFPSTEIDEWLEAALIDRGYEKEQWVTKPRLWMVHTEFGYSFKYGLN
jgi:hypothetical protein